MGGDKLVLCVQQQFHVTATKVRIHMCMFSQLNRYLKKDKNNIIVNIKRHHHHHPRVDNVQREVQTMRNFFVKLEKSYHQYYHYNRTLLGNSLLWRQLLCSKNYLTTIPISSTSSSFSTNLHFQEHLIGVQHFSTNGKEPSPGGNKKSKFKWFPLILSSSVVIGIILYNLYSIKVRYSNLLPADADLLPLPKSNGYIYIYDSLAEAGAWQSQLFPWLPQIQIDPSYTVAWRLVQDAKSDDVEKSRKAITILAQMQLEESQYHQIAQMVDYRTAVGLANSYADPRIVGVPRRHASVINLGDRFREILNSLPKHSIHQCLVDVSTAALKQYSPTEQELETLNMESLTGFESEQVHPKYRRKPKEEQFLIPCLQAILSHSRESTALLLQLKIMEVLMAVVEKYRSNREIMYIVAKIIANLTCDPNISEYIKETGCVRLLAEWSESTDIRLSLPARRALHNLDREFNTPILPPGIYQLYPDFRFNEDLLDIDIVFVHGLLGGAFRTWRREDSQPVFRVGTKSADMRKPSRIQAWIQGFSPASKGLEVMDEGKNESCEPKKQSSEKKKVKEKPKPVARIWENDQWNYYQNCDYLDHQRESSGHSENFESACWPRDWLPKDVKSARILAVDFDSFVTHWTNVCPVENLGRTLFDRSSELLTKLTSAGIGNRPIIWVTHSMGGLLVKHLLLAAADSGDKIKMKVADQTGAIMFCSVPHVGSNVAALNGAGALLLLPTQEVKELKYGSKELKKLNEKFKKLREERKYKVVSFGETKNTVSSIGVKLQLVPLDSADPGYGDFYPLETDHLNVCKVRSRSAFVYQKLVELVDNVRSKFSYFDDGEVPLPDSSFNHSQKKPKE